MTQELLAALYALAPKCEACRKHVATRRYADSCSHKVCDRAQCSDAESCDWCDYHGTVRYHDSPKWVDLPHAVALRAVNADHEVKS